MFFAVEAALIDEGLAFSSHKGVISAFGKYFVKTDRVERRLGRQLNRAFAKRQFRATTTCRWRSLASVLSFPHKEISGTGTPISLAIGKGVRGAANLKLVKKTCEGGGPKHPARAQRIRSAE